MLILSSLYGTVAVARIVAQVGVSSLERRKKYKSVTLPKATLVVAVYNEPIDLCTQALASFKAQDYPALEVIVVDDGSKNAAELKPVVESFGFTYIYQKNKGKREAMFTAFQNMAKDSEIILTADSDTIWDPGAARELAICLLQNPTTGAVTGEVAVLNHSTNLLTRLVGIRYHLAFAHERASQSYFGAVTCISGPLGCYRREVIDEIKFRFIYQFFFGKKCTYGDDRHLTNLVLEEGYKVRYCNTAKCYTYAPTTVQTLIKQQTRWSKSYWREIMYQLRVIPKHGPFLLLDWIVSFSLPFLLAFSAFHYIHSVATETPHRIAILIAVICGMGLLRVSEPLIRTRNPVFLLFMFYTYIYLFVMIPAKFYALATINDGKWGTR